MIDETAGEQSRHGVRRRTLLAGAAWSVPVIAIATATPLAAASTGARGRFVIESMLGGTWVNPQYYGASIQMRNDDTQATTLPAEPITSGVVVVTFASVDVGVVQPAIIANAGGSSPVVGALPATDPTWTSLGASDNGDGTVSYTLSFVGSISGQGVTHVSFGVLGSAPLHSGISVSVQATGSPTDGSTSSRTVTLF
ncbi:hypothetical protein [Microbacterium saperdae]|uniref:Uncharacterized protein n=1 Tax=Microbacterium saperdae TaxID=69368 RepID=A0A543BA13_9MICO|nr:hypothetical protein [Microbacterium saperdae]TQL81670.1 hypothetical protein FB560_3144 [Microbacterium saperdae]GGM33872.1 hypothetical protein GCM10010489_00800 [Microbacterium saperdae]